MAPVVACARLPLSSPNIRFWISARASADASVAARKPFWHGLCEQALVFRRVAPMAGGSAGNPIREMSPFMQLSKSAGTVRRFRGSVVAGQSLRQLRLRFRHATVAAIVPMPFAIFRYLRCPMARSGMPVAKSDSGNSCHTPSSLSASLQGREPAPIEPVLLSLFRTNPASRMRPSVRPANRAGSRSQHGFRVVAAGFPEAGIGLAHARRPRGGCGGGERRGGGRARKGNECAARTGGSPSGSIANCPDDAAPPAESIFQNSCSLVISLAGHGYLGDSADPWTAVAKLR